MGQQAGLAGQPHPEGEEDEVGGMLLAVDVQGDHCCKGQVHNMLG